MCSIRTRITAMMLAAILISVFFFGAISIYSVRNETNRLTARNMDLVCKSRGDSLDKFILSIQQSVNMMAGIAIDSLDSQALIDGGVIGATGNSTLEIEGRSFAQRQELDRYFDEHLELVELAFKSVANHTNGVSTCYYRINPEITTTAKGFYYSKRGNNDFEKLNLTEIEAYDPNDLEQVGWYYIPLTKGEPTWLKPYNTANPGGMVMSYAYPMYKEDTFIGIIGMDIRFETLTDQIKQFTDFKTGYFVLADDEGRIYYHPEITIEEGPIDAFPEVLSVITDLSEETLPEGPIRFERNGIKWQMAYSTLENDLKLAAVVQESEINDAMYKLTYTFVLVGIMILLAFVIFTTISVRQITDPLQKLTVAATKLANDDYDVELGYEGNDEVGVLTKAFCSMRDRLKETFTELSDNKEKLQESLSVSQQANRAKSIFLSNMSHEIRTPLNAILGFTYLAEENIDDRAQVYDCIQKIDTSGRHLLSLINEVLDVSRIESGRMVLHEEEFSLIELITQINTIVERQCAEKEQSFSSHIVGTMCSAYIGDEMKLKEVLINLLSNAVKYTPPNGKISFTAEQVTKYQDMCTMRFIVRDNGIGISEEYMPKLFEAFSQEAEDGSGQYGSTGLGMAITKSLVQLMNGEISVTSKKGKGSTFTVTVTLKDAKKGVVTAARALKENNEEENAPEPVKPSGTIDGLRVLIVEDMKINAELIKKVLGMKGVSYDWAENGQIAVDLFAKSQENYYDAILMDIRMPVMDGLESTRNIRALDRPDAKTVQIIAMSANAFAEDVQRSLQAGMNAHLSKPVDMNLLFETLGKVAAHESLT